MGLTRDYLNALSADGVIIVGGGSGILSEACASYMYKKPIVAIRNLNGSVESYIDDYIDHRKNIQIIGVDSAQDAVKKILELITA
jgi:predicted Rossmann-fold nucleotide-binding protein